MSWLVAGMKWIMLVSGLLTCSLIQALFAPHAALQSLFGTSLQGPVAEIVVRSWGALITLLGLLLIYGAYRSTHRVLILVVAATSKAIFVGLVLAYGTAFLSHTVGVAVAADSAMVVLFSLYVFATRQGAPAA